ncbi:glycoside hydrolase family 27 protein [Aspergillus lucknowensis]|uniref:alpha-galactosidase n=1 Tax=Aspergillus lucknowensis TaxID=176173 RepID=A0ABR4M275_9EURO
MAPLQICLLATMAMMVMAAPPLQVISYDQTVGGFNSAARGWNSFGLQANPNAAPSFSFNQASVQTQCDVLASNLAAGKYTYCSLDSGWSVDFNGDGYGRIIPNTDKFSDLPGLASHLHSKGLELGVYVVPGAFLADLDKTIYGTNTTIGSVCSGDEGLARCVFDYTQPAVQTWHDSVVNQFTEWGVDFIKLDFITPGSPNNGQNLPADQSASVVAFRKAIVQSGRQMRLDISWKLDRSATSFRIWNANADSMRTDQDLNNYNQNTLVAWGTVQRALENYRQWIVAGLQVFGETLNVRPDLDSLFVGNGESVSGVTEAQRQTLMTHWIGAGANLITGSDLTNLDSVGVGLLTNAEALRVADFTARYPMQPRNPGSGDQDPQQLQAWIAGPSVDGEAVVVLANYGPDQGDGGYGTSLSGEQTVSVSFEDLGMSGEYTVYDVWADKNITVSDGAISYDLDEGASALLYLTPS